MEHTLTPPFNPSAPAEGQQARFEEIWKRVMPNPGSSCPIALYSDEANAAQESNSGVSAAQESNAGVSAAQKAAPSTSMKLATRPATTLVAAVQAETPPENAVPCLGADAAQSGSLMQAMIAGELRAMVLYCTLASWRKCDEARILRTLASDARHHAVRLATAYFLISGVRYWPKVESVTLRSSSYLATLRKRFIAEQKQAELYRASASNTSDACLRELLEELALECASHARILRALLERVI